MRGYSRLANSSKNVGVAWLMKPACANKIHAPELPKIKTFFPEVIDIEKLRGLAPSTKLIGELHVWFTP